MYLVDDRAAYNRLSQVRPFRSAVPRDIDILNNLSAAVNRLLALPSRQLCTHTDIEFQRRATKRVPSRHLIIQGFNVACGKPIVALTARGGALLVN